MRYLRYYIILGLLFIVNYSFCQKNDQAVIEVEVNRQLWKPFKKAFEERNWELFNSLHTDDILRANAWGIKVGEAYKNSVKKSYQKKSSAQKTIDFRLVQRIYKENIGYEVGYYKIVTKKPNEEPKIAYAQFHVVLKKIDGQWKIAQDWDANELNGVKVTPEDFEKAPLLDLTN